MGVAPFRFERGTPDEGGLAIHDAVETSSGAMLVALGDAGARVLDEAGRVLWNTAEPTHALVISDDRRRAIAITDLGDDARRLTLLDLDALSATPLGVATFEGCAETFDGTLLYVFRYSELQCVDTSAGLRPIWSFDGEVTAVVCAVSREASRMALVLQDRKEPLEVLMFDTAPHRLRGRRFVTTGQEPLRGRLTYARVTPRGSVSAMFVRDGNTVGYVAHEDRGEGITELAFPTLYKHRHPGPLNDAWCSARGVWDGPSIFPIPTGFVVAELSRPDAPLVEAIFPIPFRSKMRLSGDRAMFFTERGNLVVVDCRARTIVREHSLV